MTVNRRRRPAAPVTANRSAPQATANNAAKAAAFAPRLSRLALETRILFDGAGAVAGADAFADDPFFQDAAPQSQQDEQQPNPLFEDGNYVMADGSEGDSSGVSSTGQHDDGGTAVEDPVNTGDDGQNDDVLVEEGDAEEPVGEALGGEDDVEGATTVADDGTVPTDSPTGEGVEGMVVADSEAGLAGEIDQTTGAAYDLGLTDDTESGTGGTVTVAGEDDQSGSVSGVAGDDEIGALDNGLTDAPDSESDVGVENVGGDTLDENEDDTEVVGDFDEIDASDADAELDEGSHTPAAISGLGDVMPVGMMSLMALGNGDPDPSVEIELPEEGVMLGEDFTFTLEFKNKGGTGYGPYVELYLPKGKDAGEESDGVSPDDQDDGIRIEEQGAIKYLGQDVNYTIHTVGEDHPYVRGSDGSPKKIGEGLLDLAEGQQVVIIELPFGSYTADQPVVSLQVTASVHKFADLDEELELTARAGFRYGSTAIEDYDTDPTIEGVEKVVAVKPQLVRYEYEFDHAEGETATGPNFERTMTTDIIVADGQELTDYELTIAVPDNIVVLKVDGQEPVYDELGNIVLQLNTLSGSSSVEITYYIPDVDGNEAPVIDPDTGERDKVEFNVSGKGKWTPADPRDVDVEVEHDEPGPELEHSIKSLAVQKSYTVDGDAKPGAEVDYTLNFQVSDYFQFGDVTITDTLADGHDLLNPDGSLNQEKWNVFLSTLAFTLHHQGDPYTISLADYVDHQIDPETHDITLTFRISDALAAEAAEDWPDELEQGILTGGRFDGANLGGTYGTITYSAIIADKFVSEPENGDPSVNHGDRLDSSAVINGTVRPADNPDSDVKVTDETGTLLNIESGVLSLEVSQVIRDGQILTSKDASPGDLVIYELAYDLQTGDFENLKFDVYLPMPVFDLSGFENGRASFLGNDPGSGAQAGNWWFISGGLSAGDLDSGFGLAFDEDNNKLTFDLKSREDDNNQPSRIVIRFAALVGDAPFADGLYLTAQAQASDDNTPGETATQQDMDQIRLNEPKLEVKHGVVKADGASGHWMGTQDVTDISSIDVDVTSFDAGDHVRFGLAVANVGGHGAFDVTTTEITLPDGFAWADGDGDTVAGLAEANLKVYLGGELLESETDYTVADGVITLSAEIEAGRTGNTLTSDGSNILFITYDAVALADITIGDDFKSNKGIESFTNVAGNNKDFLPGDQALTDGATLDTAQPTVKMVFKDGVLSADDTSADHTDGNNVVIGEYVYYDIVVTLPEGVTEGLTVTPTIPAGMVLDTTFGTDGYTLITQKGTGDTSSDALGANFGGAASTMTVAGGSGSVSFENITVTDNNVGNDNSFVVRVRLVADNVAGNQGGPGETGTTLTPTVTANYDKDGSSTAINIDTPVTQVVVVEPELTISKTANKDQMDAGDEVTYTIVVGNSSGVEAFDLVFEDTFHEVLGLDKLVDPDDEDAPEADWTVTANGVTIDKDNFVWAKDGATGKYTLSLKPDANIDLKNGESFTITVTAKTMGAVAGHSSFDSSAKVSWSSIDSANLGDYDDDRERTGLGGVNDYTATDNALVSVQSNNVLSRIGGLKDTVDGTPDDTADGAQQAVGEIVRFRMVVQVPEGTIPDMKVLLDLDAGYDFDPDSARIALVANGDTGGGMTASELAGLGSVAGSAGLYGNIAGDLDSSNDVERLNGDDHPERAITATLVDGKWVFSLGEVTNNDDDPDPEYIIIEFNAIVKNTADNQAGETLSTSFAVFSGDTQLGEDSNTTVDTIVEPDLSEVTKTISRAPMVEPADPEAPLPVQGDKATLEVTNRFTATAETGANAYEVVLTDSLEHGENYAFVSLTVDGTTYNSVEDAGNAGYTVTMVDANGGVRLEFGDNPLQPGQAVELKYSVEVPADRMGNNTPAQVTWSSLPDGGDSHFPSFAGTSVGDDGTNTGERIWTDVDDHNNYRVDGEAGYGMISGTLWDDTPQQDGSMGDAEDEPRLENVRVELRNSDGDLIAATLTGADGSYAFGGVPMGEYTVVAPSSFSHDFPHEPGNPDADTLTPTVAGGSTVSVTLTTPSVSEHNNIGYLRENDEPILVVGGDDEPIEVIATETDHDSGDDSHIPPTQLLPGLIEVGDPDLGEKQDDSTVFGAGKITVTLEDHILNDKLALDNLAGLSGIAPVTGDTPAPAYNATDGTLTIYLAETATIGQVKAILAAIRYSHVGDDPTNNKAKETDPDAVPRTEIAFKVELDDGKNKTGDGSDSGTGPARKVTVEGVITLEVDNDPPMAENDVNTLTNQQDEVSGNLITGGRTNGDGDSSTGTPDSDPDTPIEELMISSIWADGGDPVEMEDGVFTIQGKYGELVVQPDGSYEYVLNQALPEVYGLAEDATLSEVFTYVMSDGEHNSNEAALTITITGGEPGESSITGENTVHESGLRSPTDDDERDTVTGQITVTTPSGLTGVTVAGKEGEVTIDLSDLIDATEEEPIVIETEHGTLTITGFTTGTGDETAPKTGTIEYSYTLREAVDKDDVENDEIGLTVHDQAGENTSGKLTITIVNDVPEAKNDRAEVPNVGENDEVSGNVITGSGSEDVADIPGADSGIKVTNVESNQTGESNTVPDGANGVTIQGEHGKLTIHADGSYTYERDDDGPLTATDVFTYTITDSDGDEDTATLTIHIDDKGPVITDVDGNTPTAPDPADPDSIPEVPGGTVYESHLPDGSDPGEPTVTGTITFTPGDGTSTITVTPPGGTPVEVEVGTPIETEHGTVTITSIDPENGTITYEYELKKPTTDVDGADETDEFVVTITDEDSDAASVKVVVDIVDDQPQANHDENEVRRSQPTASGNVYDNDEIGADGYRDPDNPNPITDVEHNGGGEVEPLTEGGGWKVEGTYGDLTIHEDGSYTYTLREGADIPKEGDTEVFTYTITDSDGDSATATLTINVSGNTDPVANPDERTTREDTPVSGNVIKDGGPGDTPDGDEDGDELKVTEFTVGGQTVLVEPGTPGTAEIPGVGTITIHEDGGYTFTPVPDWHGSVPVIEYTVDDGNGGTATSTLTITVTPVPDAVNDRTTTMVDEPVTIDPLKNDSFSGPNPKVSVEPGDGPSNGTVTVHPDGRITYTPDPGFIGEDTFTYTVVSGGRTETATVTIVVGNNPPIPLPDTSTVPQDTPATGNVLTNDHDPDGHPIEVTEFSVGGNSYPPGSTVDIPGVGTITVGGDGGYTFTPEPGWHGDVPTITYTVSDGKGGTATSTLIITVTPVDPGEEVPGGEPPVDPETPPSTFEPPAPEDDIRFQHPDPGIPGIPGAPGTGGSVADARPGRPVAPGGLFQQIGNQMRSPVMGNQVEDPSVYFYGSVYDKIPRLPLPFHPIVYVNREVQAAQEERAVTDVRSMANIFWSQPGEIGSTSIGAGLGQDPNLYVQHAVRGSQRQGSFFDSVVAGRLGRVGLGADGALPTPDLSEPLSPQMRGAQQATPAAEEASQRPEPAQSEQPEQQAAVEAVPAALAAAEQHAAEEDDVRLSLASPSFSEQLRGGSGRLPVVLQAPKDLS